ncbi:oligosaccharide flippase family protein [Bacillus thuringiensis]|jgi:O-antigen/teichoic acid export membrane protein|uniref:lipopolysaccharide biosynthesis protein n=1 Tax=Bacillus thuringiensis TaxID=1428 RepID=UPI0022252F38|nr:oligosaccharide flippase family protein [Bacillus thuringiensis]UYX51961.1 oligosaccharide flippase family protein [Bacillus thuringiensis]
MKHRLITLSNNIRNSLVQLGKKGFFSLLLTKFLIQFLGFGSIILVAKFINPESMAQIRSLQTYLTLAVILGTFGLDTAILKFCAEKREDIQKEKILSYSVRNSLLFSFLSILLFNLFLIFISKQYSIHWGIYTLCVPILVLTNILINYLLALKKVNKMASIQAIIKVQSALFIIIGTWLFGVKGFIISTVLGLAIGLYPLFKEANPVKRLDNSNMDIPKQFWGIAFFSFLANFVNNIGNYADIIIMDNFVNDRVEMGYYSIATIFLLGATQITATLQSIYTPYLTEKSNNYKGLKEMAFNVQKKAIILSIGAGLAVYIGSLVFVPFFYGEAYKSTITYTGILMVKYVLYSSYAIMGVTLLAMGKMKENFYVTLISAPIALVINYVALQYFGIIGIAWAQIANGAIMLSLQYITVFLVFKRLDKY